MNTFPSHDALFRKSSYSSASANCVEVADLPDGRHAIRDTRNRDLGGFLVPRNAWAAFLDGVRTGEFDA